jgi:multidrug efflux pump subunit AcrA (membrane-fusion protein)
LLVQLQIDNPGGVLKPGDYAQVKFDLPAEDGALRAPASALIFGDTGMSLALVGADDRVAIRPVRISRDLGSSVEIASGLTPADRIIDNPPDSLRAGDRVRVAVAGEGSANAR